jgi:hypothetical protein
MDNQDITFNASKKNSKKNSKKSSKQALQEENGCDDEESEENDKSNITVSKLKSTDSKGQSSQVMTSNLQASSRANKGKHTNENSKHFSNMDDDEDEGYKS